MTPQVVAVVPTYRPDAAALHALLDSLRRAEVRVLVVDDGSGTSSFATLDAVAATGVQVVRHAQNVGIARSLNDGLRAAQDAGARWLLSIDQDSRLADGYPARMLAAAEASVARLGAWRVGAVGAAGIDDASGAIGYPVTLVDGLPTTAEVIQTGTLWSVPAMVELGGFDESLGIDAVDAAACLRLRESGRIVALAPRVRIDHRLGNARQLRLLGRTVVASGHSPERRTTMVRNRLRLAPAEFRQSPVHALRTLRRVAVSTLLAVTVEDDRWAKAKASARGLLPAPRR